MSTLDFNSPPAGHKFTASIERDETDGERRVRLGKEIALFAVAIGFVMLIVGYFLRRDFYHRERRRPEMGNVGADGGSWRAFRFPGQEVPGCLQFLMRAGPTPVTRREWAL